ncbi:MAG: hypothetical protein H7062_25385 [Candidatus Saccharimonas sp.]|nr:hypothetical protein [Planctomycetaceae bacterium]
MKSMTNVIVLIAALGVAIAFTVPKLFKMCQIKGWVPGASATNEVITQKWHQTPEQHPSGRDSYWIAWGITDIKTVGGHRLNVPSERWERLNVGDTIEVVRLPGDRWPYLRDGIFVSAENFIFDFLLLNVELGVAIFMVRALIRSRRSGAPDAI